jgi:hypothetical protein
VWNEAYSSVCQRHSSVVAAFESPHGRIALLLSQTLTPTPEEMARWCEETAMRARTITSNLRAGGLRSDVTILQWCSQRRIADVVAHWDCTYEGDERRYAQLVESVGTRIDIRPPGHP